MRVLGIELPRATDLESSAANFLSAPMQTLVAPGRCTHARATVMVRTAWPGRHRVVLRSTADDRDTHEQVVRPSVDLVRSDGTFALQVPAPGRSLEPATRYRVFVDSHAGGRVGEAELVTAPAPGSREAAHATFGLVSCHNPFAPDGSLDPDALRTLEVAPRTLRTLGATRVFLAGDQVYGDQPDRFSLFDPDYFRLVGPPGRGNILDCSAEEVRRLYHQRYRTFWKTRAFRELQSGFACHPILDDHEIVDNFGSDPAHATPRWRNVRAGALAAFHDYQGRRVFGNRPRRSFDHGFRHGDVAAYVLDLRSRRVASGERIEILGRPQLGRLTRFLQREEDAKALVLVLSVPILHVPDWMATFAAKVSGEGSDAADRWSCARAQDSRDALLQVLVQHQARRPAQRMVLAGGDIHVGAAMRFCLTKHGRDALQLVSSAISNRQRRLHEWLAESLPTARSVMGRGRGLFTEATLLPGIRGSSDNPFGGLNFGLIDIDASGDEVGVRLRLLTAAEQPARTTTPYDSGWV